MNLCPVCKKKAKIFVGHCDKFMCPKCFDKTSEGKRIKKEFKEFLKRKYPI